MAGMPSALYLVPVAFACASTTRAAADPSQASGPDPGRLGGISTGIGIAAGDLHLASERSDDDAVSGRLDLRLRFRDLDGAWFSRGGVSGSLGWGGAKLEGGTDVALLYGLRPSFGRWHGLLAAAEGHYNLADDGDSSREVPGAGLELGYQVWVPSWTGRSTYLEIGAIGEAARESVSYKDVASNVDIAPAAGGILEVGLESVSLSARYLRLFGSQRGMSTPLDDVRLFTCAAIGAVSLCADTGYDAVTGFASTGAAEHVTAAYVGGLVSFDPFRYFVMNAVDDLERTRRETLERLRSSQ
jgi:hypothetical protein